MKYHVTLDQDLNPMDEPPKDMRDVLLWEYNRATFVRGCYVGGNKSGKWYVIPRSEFLDEKFLPMYAGWSELPTLEEIENGMKRFHVTFLDPVGNPISSAYEYAKSKKAIIKKYGVNVYSVEEA